VFEDVATRGEGWDDVETVDVDGIRKQVLLCVY